MQRNPHSYQIATGYRTFYSLSLIYQPITKTIAGKHQTNHFDILTSTKSLQFLPYIQLMADKYDSIHQNERHKLYLPLSINIAVQEV